MLTPLSLLDPPKLQLFDDEGNPAAGYFLYTYIAGTDDPLATYSDSNGETANSDPIELDEAGRATVYLTPGIGYKFVLRDAENAEVWTQDNVIDLSSYLVGALISTSGTKGATDGYTILPTDHLVTVDSDAGATGILLPAANERSLPITIKNVGSSVVTLNADMDHVDCFEGDASIVLFDLPAASSPLFPTVTLIPGPIDDDADENSTWWVTAGASGQGA